MRAEEISDFDTARVWAKEAETRALARHDAQRLLNSRLERQVEELDERLHAIEKRFWRLLPLIAVLCWAIGQFGKDLISMVNP